MSVHVYLQVLGRQHANNAINNRCDLAFIIIKS